MLKYYRFGILFLMLGLALSACWMPAVQQAPVPDGQSAGGSQIWFDAPLTGMVIPLQPYEIVLHANSPNKVTQVELKANQTLLGNLPNPGSQENLVTLTYNWAPAAPGIYTLTARAQDGNGHWGAYAATTVTVGDITPTQVVSFTPTLVISFTPTQVDTFTPTPVITVSPTQHNTVTPGPVVVTALTFSRQVSTSLFYYGSCSPNQVTVQASVSNPGSVKSLVLFQKLQSQSQVENWDAGTAMSSLGSGTFSVTIAGASVPNHNNYPLAHWVYQLVATNSSGQVVGRSQNYVDDVDLAACTIAPRLIVTTVIPVRPPVIHKVISVTPTYIIVK